MRRPNATADGNPRASDAVPDAREDGGEFIEGERTSEGFHQVTGGLDSAIARLFGLSRTRAAEIIGDGGVLVDGSEAGKSDRVLRSKVPALMSGIVHTPECLAQLWGWSFKDAARRCDDWRRSRSERERHA